MAENLREVDCDPTPSSREIVPKGLPVPAANSSRPKPASSALPIPSMWSPHPKPPSHALHLGGLALPESQPRFWGKACSAYPIPSGRPLPAFPPSSSPSVFSSPPAPMEIAGPRGAPQSRKAADIIRLKKPSDSAWLVQQWNVILGKLGSLSTLSSSLASSQFASTHSARVLDQFAPSTLMKYFSVFLRFHENLVSLRVQLDDITESVLADVLVAGSLARKADPESGCGCTSTIKAIRWVSTHAGVACLKVAWGPLVESCLRSRIPKELKESAPLPLYVVFHLERRLLHRNCSPSEVWLLGAILVTLWGGLRFADAQRCSWDTFVWDSKCLRASCWRTKTSHKGQPFGIWASGFASLGSHSWLWKWLSTLDHLWHLESSTNLAMPIPDFLFPKMSALQVESPWAPMSYPEALFWIRHVGTLPWKAPPLSLPNVTAHSMKNRLLTWGAQLIAAGTVSQEERMLQGHHRQGHSRSLRLYSRDDVFGQLTFQQKVIQAVHSGRGFQVPQQRGAHSPMVEPSLDLDYFRTDVPQYTWLMFPFGNSEAPPVPQTDILIRSPGSSSSSSSSDESFDRPQRPFKKSRTNPDFTQLDECLFGSVSHVQHAMVFTQGESLPTWGEHSCTAACGMYLNPARCFISTEVDSAKQLCQHRACQKAWLAWLS